MKRALVLSLLLASILRAEDSLDLIIVAGQSNAVGFDADPAQLPINNGDKDIMFWWRCGDPPPDEHDSTSNGWTTLQPQPRGNPADKASAKRQYGNFSHASGGFGPEIAFARTLQEKEHKRIAVVKAAFSGTGVRMDWNPTSPGEDGICYRALVKEVKDATTAAKQKGITLNVRALVWVQGESDANAGDAPQYEKRLGDMIEALRKDIAAPKMAALIGVNTNFGNGKNTFMPAIVEAQQKLCTHLARSIYVDTSNNTYANGAHFDTAGTLDVGKRFAEALFKLEVSGK